jgi:hypothetical protein
MLRLNTALVWYEPCLSNAMHLLHREAAKQHELAAQAHRTASEHNEKGDNPTGNWHSERALENSDHAYELAKQAHNKSDQIGKL